MTHRRNEAGAAAREKEKLPSPTKLPPELQTALLEIGSALDGAIRLALPNAEYDDDGTPLSSDAEVEDACRTAREALGRLEKILAEGRAAVLRTVFEECKHRLYQQAVTNFEDADDEEQEAFHHKAGRFEGAFRVATELVPDLERLELFREAGSTLMGDLRESIPRLRNAAADRPEAPTSEEGAGRTRFRESVDRLGARFDLLEHETALDNLLHHAAVTETGLPEDPPPVLYEEGWAVYAAPAGSPSTSEEGEPIDFTFTEEGARNRLETIKQLGDAYAAAPEKLAGVTLAVGPWNGR